MCESGYCMFICLFVLGVGGGTLVSVGRETVSGPWAEGRQLPRKLRPFHPWDSSFAPGTCPQVTITRPHPLQLPDPVSVSQPGFGVSPVPLRQAGASWGRDWDLGRARVGARGCPREVREEGKGSREPLLLGLLELPALPERRPRL